MPATTVKHIIFKITVDNKEAKKATEEQKKSFEDLIKELGGARAALLKFTEAADTVYQKMKALSSYLKDFSNPSIAAWRTAVFSAETAWKAFNLSLKVGELVVQKVGDAIISATMATVKFSFELAKDIFTGVIKGAVALTKALIDLVTDGLENVFNYLVDSAKNFAQFEDILGHARRTMGLTREETLNLGDSLIALSTDFSDMGLKAGISADKLAEIAGVAGQLGINIKDDETATLGFIETVGKVGIAFDMSLGKAAEGLAILENLYNVPIEQTANLASSIAQLGFSTVANAEQIIDIMTRMGGIAGVLGVTAQEAAAIAATLREAGVSSQVAGTAMTQVFSKMASDWQKFGEVLGGAGLSGEMLKIAIESGNATDALTMVASAIQQINATEGKIAAIQALNDLGLQGSRVLNALLGISNNIPKLNELIGMSNDAFTEGVAVQNAYEAAIDNSRDINDRFFTVLDAIQKIIGKDLAIAFSKFQEKYLIPFANKFKEWLLTSESAKAILGEGGLIDKGLTAIGEGLEKVTPIFFEFLDSLDTTAASAVDALVEKMKYFFVQNEEGFTGFELLIKEKWQSIKDAISEKIDEIKQKLEAWWAEHGPQIKQFANQFLAFVTNIEAMGNAFKEVKSTVKAVFAVFDQTGKVIGVVWENLRGFLKDFEFLGNIASGLVNGLIDKMVGLDDSIKQAEEDATGNSLFPDMIDSTEIAIGKVDSLAQTYDSLAEAIAAGDFSVDALGQTFQGMTNKANEAFSTVMAQTQAATQAIAQAGGLDAGTMSELLKMPGFFSSQGMMDAQKQLNIMNRQNSGIPVAGATQFNRGVPAQGKSQEQSMNVTLVMDDQEVGRFLNVAADRQQQTNRRSPGNNQAGRSGGRI